VDGQLKSPGYPVHALCMVDEQLIDFTVLTQSVPADLLGRTGSCSSLSWSKSRIPAGLAGLFHIFTDHNNQSTTDSQRNKRC
jgi:hypothetical protein